jgi:uncharacterized protein YndB with AHSA1/START domain
MQNFNVQAVRIEAPKKRVFDFVSEPANLPRWAAAFRAADGRSARMETAQGSVNVQLETDSREQPGTIDWHMTFPDGVVAAAFSRVTPDGDSASIFSFVLMAPPAPLEAMEGALERQREILAGELVRLKQIVENDDRA